MIKSGVVTRAIFEKGDDLRVLDFYGVESIDCGLSEVNSLKEAIGDADIVYNLAAHTTEGKSEERYYEKGAKGFKNLLEASMSVGVKRLIHLSSVDVYGPQPSTTHINEAFPLRPELPLQKYLLDLERIGGEHIISGLEPALTVLRHVQTFGPRDKGLSKTLFEAVKAGEIKITGKSSSRFSMIYVKDIAKACVTASKTTSSAGRTFIVSGFETSLPELAQNFLDEVNPKAAIRSYSRFAASISSLSRKLGVSTDEAGYTMNEVVASSKASLYSDERFREATGFKPEYGLAEGVKETVNWFSGKVVP